MSFDRLLSHNRKMRRFSVRCAAAGWDVSEQEGPVLLKQVHRDDWHRVERDIGLFELSARALKEKGWIEHFGIEMVRRIACLLLFQPLV